MFFKCVWLLEVVVLQYVDYEGRNTVAGRCAMLQTGLYSTLTRSRKSFHSLNPTLPLNPPSQTRNTLEVYRFSSESCTNLSFLISYSTNQQINHTINQASNPANDSINQKTPPSISISLPTGFLSGRLSHAVYQTPLIDFFETTGCSRICAGLCGPKALGMIPDSQQQNKPQQTMSNGCIYIYVYIYAV